jgi:hypothetical protein
LFPYRSPRKLSINDFVRRFSGTLSFTLDFNSYNITKDTIQVVFISKVSYD